MMWSKVNPATAGRHFEEMCSANSFAPADLTPEYRHLREELLRTLRPFGMDGGQGIAEYDVAVGLALYRVLGAAGFTVRNAADDGVWRHLSLNVFPDLVAGRWPHMPEKRFWRSRSRIWLRVVWWLTHLAWQGSETQTRSVLSDVTTDTIVQLIERPGRAGFRIELARALFHERGIREFSQNEFRALMKLNTARVLLLEPYLVEGGVSGYAKELYMTISATRDARVSALKAC